MAKKAQTKVAKKDTKSKVNKSKYKYKIIFQKKPNKERPKHLKIKTHLKKLFPLSSSIYKREEKF